MSMAFGLPNKKNKKGVDKSPLLCYNNYNKGKQKEITTMKFYEIKNTKTNETAQATAPNFANACRAQGWKPWDCKCVWSANPENGY